MLLSDELVLDIEPRIFEFVGRPRQGVAVSRVHIRGQSEGADRQGIADPALLLGQSPIGRRAAHHVGLRADQWMSTPGNGRGVNAELSVEVIVQPHIRAKTAHGLAESARPAVDLRRRGVPGRRRAGSVGETPGRGCVPDILHGGVVIQRNPHEHVVVVVVRASERQVVRVAKIRIVESEMILVAIVGQLHERTEAVGDLARVEETHLLLHCPATQSSCECRKSAP